MTDEDNLPKVCQAELDDDDGINKNYKKELEEFQIYFKEILEKHKSIKDNKSFF